MAEDSQFHYVAVDGSGRRVGGAITARSDLAAFERLKREGLSPVRLRIDRRAAVPARGKAKLNDRELGAFLSDLAVLLRAGADMRAALSILSDRSDRIGSRDLARALTAEIGGGGAIDRAFENHLGRDRAFVSALVAAGEAAGDLAGGLQRSAEMLESQVKLRAQMVSVLSYPAFVFASTILAVAVILLFIVPSLEPLVREGGGDPPLALKVLLSVSAWLRTWLAPLGLGLALAVAALAISGISGFLTRPLEAALLDGPIRRTFGSLSFGGFAVALGHMLSAGAPMSEALRLATHSVRSGLARERLQVVAQEVRQGESLSRALDRVPRFPPTILRLAAIGEASGALGAMLERGGRVEEEQAIRRLEAIGRILGPALIVALGGLVGTLMASLLSGVSQLGQSVLQ